MMKTLIHVGLHKCASTYLQRHVFPKMDAHCLRLGNYPDVGEPFLDEIRFSETFDAPAFADRVVRVAGADPCGEGRLVLSHEALSGDPHGQDLWDPVRMAFRLRDAFPGSGVLLVVRNQFDYVQSMYAWRVCQAGMVSRGMSAFLRRLIAGGLDRKLQYDRLVTHYQAIFGVDRLLVLPVEMLRHDHVVFLQNVRRFVDAEFRDLSVYDPVRGENESTRSTRVIGLLRAMNLPVRIITTGLKRAGLRGMADGLVHRYHDFKRFWLLPMLKQRTRDSAPIEPPPWLHEEYGEVLAASNARLVQMTGLSLSDYRYPLPNSQDKG